MAQRVHRGRRPNGSGENKVRSVRISDEVWEKANRRAAFDGVTISHVMAQIVEGYAQGLVNLPKVHIDYNPPPIGPTGSEQEVAS